MFNFSAQWFTVEKIRGFTADKIRESVHDGCISCAMARKLMEKYIRS